MAALLLLLLAGCGNKGPLLPAPAEPPPAPAPATGSTPEVEDGPGR